jgi:hypothetical protein
MTSNVAVAMQGVLPCTCEITTQEQSEILGTLDIHWALTRMLYEIKINEGFSPENLLQALGTLELKVLRVTDGDVPQEEGTF